MPLMYIEAEIYILKEELRIMDMQNLGQTKEFQIKQEELRQVVGKYNKAKIFLEKYFDMCSKNGY